MQKKYSLSKKKTITFFDAKQELTVTREAHRITALIDIPRHNVRAGDEGGYVSGESCLSHEGDAWIGGNAYVENWRSSAFISVEGDALVTDEAVIFQSRIAQHAIVKDNAFVNESVVRGYSIVEGNGKVHTSEILDEAVVSEDAIIRRSKMEANASAMGRAVLGSSWMTDVSAINGSVVVSASRLSREAFVTDSARVSGSHLTDNALVLHKSQIADSFLTGGTEIQDSVYVGKGCFIEGNTILTGSLEVLPHSHITGKKVHGDYKTEPYGNDGFGRRPVQVDPVKPYTPDLFVPPFPALPERSKSLSKKTLSKSHHHKAVDVFESASKKRVGLRGKLDSIIDAALGREINEVETSAAAAPVLVEVVEEAKSDELAALVGVVAEVEASYHSYTTDIVKLLKYPLMADASIPEIAEFILRLKQAKRAVLSNKISKIAPAVEALELAFLKAENKVITAQKTTLDAGQKKKLELAEKTFALVLNESTPENEKKAGLKAGLRALEGVIHVSDEAVGALKTKAGLLAIEA